MRRGLSDSCRAFDHSDPKRYWLLSIINERDKGLGAGFGRLRDRLNGGTGQCAVERPNATTSPCRPIAHTTSCAVDASGVRRGRQHWLAAGEKLGSICGPGQTKEGLGYAFKDRPEWSRCGFIFRCREAPPAP